MISIPRLPSTSTHPHTTQQSHYHQYPTEYHPNYQPDFSSNIDFSKPTFNNLAAFNQQFPSDLMQSDSWTSVATYAPKLGRISHQRESSLSSLGSAGPASPFANNTSNPQIAVTDSGNDALVDMHSHDNIGTSNPTQIMNGGNSYYHLSKSLAPYSGYQSCSNMDPTMPEMAYPMTIAGPDGKPRADRGLLPAPDFGNAANRSHPTSVASSIAGDSPATPTVHEASTSNNRRKGELPDTTSRDSSYSHSLPIGYANAPKLDRTMTDVYSDELYSPHFAITSTSPSHSQMAVSPTNDLFNQRLHAANNQHLSAVHSPASSTSRDRSPFRAGSPLAPSPSHDFGTALPQNIQFNSAQRVREQNKAQQEAQLLQQQLNRNGVEPETPKTISPKDAVLEFGETDAESNFPLFPQDSSNFEMDHFSKAMATHPTEDVCSQPNTSQNGGAGHFNYMPTQLSTGIQVPQQYPFIANTRPSHETPPRLSSAGSSSAESGSNTPANFTRPTHTGAESGTYTCTYHGCSLRFETPALLQKHKREGHRQTQPVTNGPHSRDIGMTSSLLNSQAGPHRCDRINPSTGKSCNTVFSRPYDLTRHEDTIHNARKQKVRCDVCQEEKTFSRADALTRHYRVCHPELPLPGKHRRRGGG